MWSWGGSIIRKRKQGEEPDYKHKDNISDSGNTGAQVPARCLRDNVHQANGNKCLKV